MWLPCSGCHCSHATDTRVTSATSAFHRHVVSFFFSKRTWTIVRDAADSQILTNRVLNICYLSYQVHTLRCHTLYHVWIIFFIHKISLLERVLITIKWALHAITMFKREAFFGSNDISMSRVTVQNPETMSQLWRTIFLFYCMFPFFKYMAVLGLKIWFFFLSFLKQFHKRHSCWAPTRTQTAICLLSTVFCFLLVAKSISWA